MDFIPMHATFCDKTAKCIAVEWGPGGVAMVADLPNGVLTNVRGPGAAAHVGSWFPGLREATADSLAGWIAGSAVGSGGVGSGVGSGVVLHISNSPIAGAAAAGPGGAARCIRRRVPQHIHVRVSSPAAWARLKPAKRTDARPCSHGCRLTVSWAAPCANAFAAAHAGVELTRAAHAVTHYPYTHARTHTLILAHLCVKRFAAGL